ncbi:hypothetical protein AAL_01348 [Moelleriella libera RCEF 2490]|uniref:Uncharacterized protein n=1 Tax=Moelleriella libera RCEF 2490 TaxID=1081109 RepID=A0A162K232_9HYPO|nr:hypothetical protein AAL_01348 [Moelleriella libera RCEF 2490]
MPAEPLELEHISMFGFGAIPNLESLLSTDAPLKHRLRPRKEKVTYGSDDGDVVFVNVHSRQMAQKSSGHAPRGKLKATFGDRSLPIQSFDSEGTAPSIDRHSSSVDATPIF